MEQEYNIPGEDADSIDRFIRNQMSTSEAEQFRIRMENDEWFRNRVKEMQLLAIGIQESALQGKIKSFHTEIPRTRVVRLSTYRWLAAAVILLVASTLVLFIAMPSENEKLFSTYFQPDPGLISKMAVSDNYAFDLAMIDYKTGKYEKAVTAWQELRKNDPANDTLSYFIGSAYLSLKKSGQAIPYFREVVSHQKSAFVNEANWYLGLSLIHAGKKQEAAGYIEKTTHRNKDQLLQKLTGR